MKAITKRFAPYLLLIFALACENDKIGITIDRLERIQVGSDLEYRLLYARDTTVSEVQYFLDDLIIRRDIYAHRDDGSIEVAVYFTPKPEKVETRILEFDEKRNVKSISITMHGNDGVDSGWSWTFALDGDGKLDYYEAYNGTIVKHSEVTWKTTGVEVSTAEGSSTQTCQVQLELPTDRPALKSLPIEVINTFYPNEFPAIVLFAPAFIIQMEDCMGGDYGFSDLLFDGQGRIQSFTRSSLPVGEGIEFVFHWEEVDI